MLILAKISFVLVGLLLSASLVQYVGSKGGIRRRRDVLGLAIYEMEQEQIRIEEQKERKQEADRIQKTKVFYMDVRVTHGSAFGGFCATMNDGRRKKGLVRLDEILLYGKHPSGKEFTYYIEDQNIEIGATDDPDTLLIRSSDNSQFEIRQIGQGRDEGSRVENALIHRDIQYYIILESKHEISLKAVKGC
ncbi:MAG: hypothetical protein Q4E53_02965 [Eubacteriales bacterium]|nr:hypothetical protein [Eubacteriales bacterium]